MQNIDKNTAGWEAPPKNPLAQTPSPDNPPWGWVAALLVWIASVALIFIVPSVVVIPYVMSKGINLQDAEGLKSFLLTDFVAILLQTLLVIPIHAITLALSWAVVTNFKKFSFRQTLGWEWGGFKIWHIVAIIASFFLFAVLLNYLFGEQDNDLLRILRSSRAAVYIIAFLATFTAPLVEEVVYRGILYSAFQRSIGVPWAVFLATALFALVHVPQYYPSFATIILICLLSFILTLVRAKTGNLLPCIVLHTVFNGIQSLLLVFEPVLRRIANQASEQTASILHFIK
jgi:membrane protease YdiL (CAAX protease family)